jgi:formate--tetrahydrofolate ligase
VIENHIHHGNSLRIDPDKIFWRRTLDISDRQLRQITVGMSKSCNLKKHASGFDITAASEVMAALSLSTSIQNLKAKLSNIGVALNQDGKLVTAKDLKVVGAMALLLKDAIKPNLVQTLEGQPVLIHTGPFANVSHGNNSVLSTLMALKLSNYVVTESGFGTDLGLEKLFDIVSREGGFKPAVAVLVVSAKAIKSHASAAVTSKKMSEMMKEGFANINHHIQNIQHFGVPVVVAINRFPNDTDEELKCIQDFLQSENVEHAISDGVRLGGEGTVSLAEKILKVLADRPADFKNYYSLELTPEEKIEKIALGLYGASGVSYSEQAKEDLSRIRHLGLEHLPVNIAKTPYSLSDDAKRKGVPTGWTLKVEGVRPYSGAGFLVVLCGKMILMPGLPEKPALEDMDLTNDGEAKGLF